MPASAHPEQAAHFMRMELPADPATPEVHIIPPAEPIATPAPTAAQSAPVKRAPGQHKENCPCKMCQRIADKKKRGGEVTFKKAGEASGNSLTPSLKPGGKSCAPLNTSSTSIPQKVAAMRAEQTQANHPPVKTNEPTPTPERAKTWWDALKNPLGV